MAKNEQRSNEVSIRNDLKRDDGTKPSVLGDIKMTKTGKPMIRLAQTIPIAQLEQAISRAKHTGNVDNRGTPVAWVNYNMFSNQIEDFAKVVLPAVEEFGKE